MFHWWMCDGLMHAIMLLFIEGILIGAFFTMYYAPKADAALRENSVAPHLNGELNSLPYSYTCKFKMLKKISVKKER